MMSARQHSSAQGTLLLVLVCILLIIGHFARPFVYRSGDIDIYQSIAENVWKAEDLLKSEYPPLTSALFALMHPPALSIPFPDAWSAFLTVACVAAAAWAAWTCSPREGCIVLLSILATMLLLGLDITWGRYDLLVGMLLLLTLVAHRRRKFAASGLFLLLATGLKLVPIVLLPVVYTMTDADARRHVVKGAIAGTAIAVLVPLLVLGPAAVIENALSMVLYHAGRGVQLESTWSGLSILWEVLHGHRATVLFLHRSHENAEVWKSIPLLSTVLGLVGLCGLFRGLSRANDIAPAMLCVLAWLLFLSPVLSPQYISWLLPLLVAWGAAEFTAGRPSRLTIAALCIGVGIGLLTNWFYLPLYLNLVDTQDVLPVLVLNLRNALLLIFAIACYRAKLSRSRRTSVG